MTPEEREAQREAALRRANEFRQARSKLCKQIRAGEKTVSEVLTEPFPEWLLGMPVVTLLSAPKGWSKRRARRWLADMALHGLLHISEYRKCGQLTDREKRVLSQQLKTQEGGGKDDHD